MKKPTSKPRIEKRSTPPISVASGIPVHCKFDEIIPSTGLKFFPGNYKKHPAKQLDRFERVVAGDGNKPGNGWRRAIVVSKLSGCVTKGNGALAMALRRGWDVPVEYQDYETRAEEIRDVVADNAVSELATTDDEALRKLLSELDAADVALTGVSTEEFEKLLAESDIPEGEFPITAKLHESYDYVLIFADNTPDIVFLQNLCGIQPERSYKKTGVGLGRAIPFQKFIHAIRENRHSLDVQGGNHDHAQADPKRGGRGASKPGARVRKSK